VVTQASTTHLKRSLRVKPQTWNQINKNKFEGTAEPDGFDSWLKYL